MFLDLTSSSSSRGRRTGMFLGGGAIDAGKELGETTALLLVVDVRRRGPGTQCLAGITAPEKEPR